MSFPEEGGDGGPGAAGRSSGSGAAGSGGGAEHGAGLWAGLSPDFPEGDLDELLEAQGLGRRLVPAPLREGFQRVELAGGGHVAIKVSRTRGQLEGEAFGLGLIFAASRHASFLDKSAAFSVPEVHFGCRTAGTTYLASSILDLSSPPAGNADWHLAGRALVALQRAGGELRARTGAGAPAWGLEYDTWLGGTLQANACEQGTSWPQFFARNRLGRLIVELGGQLDPGTCAMLERILARIDGLLPADVEALLLHGDLWPGNFSCLADAPRNAGGAAGARLALWDPAVSFGHCLSDLAMATMFGGVPEAFYRGYAEAAETDLASADTRAQLAVYRLYHFLNHQLLFGNSYTGSVAATVREICSYIA